MSIESEEAAGLELFLPNDPAAIRALGKMGVKFTEAETHPGMLRANFPSGYRKDPRTAPLVVMGPDTQRIIVHYEDGIVEITSES